MSNAAQILPKPHHSLFTLRYLPAGLVALRFLIAPLLLWEGGITLTLVGIVGTIHTLEEIAMTLILPRWTHDVLSIVHALKLRRNSSLIAND